jgi:hypothetical protein
MLLKPVCTIVRFLLEISVIRTASEVSLRAEVFGASPPRLAALVRMLVATPSPKALATLTSQISVAVSDAVKSGGQ